MKKLALVILLGLGLISAFTRTFESPAPSSPGYLPQVPVLPQSTATPTATATARGSTDQQLAAAFANRQSGLQIQGAGTVERVLSDDNDGSRHQRFILRLDSGQTLLVAHNIDLAPRIGSIASGDRVEFFGEYEWNAQGGVIHWTHHDPAGRHPEGWLRHRGRSYK